MSAPRSVPVDQDELYDVLKLGPGPASPAAPPAPARPPHPEEERTDAIVPDRVLVLTVGEQLKIADVMGYLARGDDLAARRLDNRIRHGDEYNNPADELARITLRKRRLEGELRRVNQRITAVEEMVVEELQERGERAIKHDGTGATLSLARKIWAKVVREGEKPTDDEKAAAAQGLINAGLGHYVQPGFNTNSISAYFREQIKTYDEEQRSLPEDERVPRTVESFLPPELVGLIELDDNPTISVTAPRS